MEFPGLISSNHLGIPMAESIFEQVKEYMDAVNEVDVDIRTNCIAPTDVDVSGKIEDGKTILRYYGTVTRADGVTRPYEKIYVFDFILTPDFNI